MHDRTRRLGFLDAAICERLLAEALAKRFTQHAPGRFGSTGPLRHGESAYIRELTPTGNAVYQDNLADFPVFRSFLDAVFGARDVGKSYWHRLKAGRQIYRHIDCG